MSGLETRLETILRASPKLMRVLRASRDLNLPDPLVFSGAIYQTALNALTGHDPDYGLKDYDLGYFDGADLSYEAEDAIVRHAAAALDADLADKIELRNQARVHLWFERRFGEPYTRLASTAQALERFVSPLFAVGARLEVDDGLTVIAPFGLDDLFALELRANPRRPSRHFASIAEKLVARWPQVKVTS